MGRPRRFDETAVLDAAAGQFRVHGYADTSTEQLCEAADVRRSSLYNTFISKEELFVRALERYIDTTTALRAVVLEDESLDAAQRLRAYLELAIDEEDAAVREGRAAGCMVVSAHMSPDLSARDERIRRLLEENSREQRATLEAAIRLGQAEGTIRPEVAPREGAALVMSLISGMRVMSQAGTPPAELRAMTLLGLNAILL